MTNSKNKQNKDESLVGIIAHRFVPFWPLFAVLIVLAGAGSWVYLYFSTPTFQATATLIIKDEQKGVDDSDIMESMNVFNSKKIVENEIEVIQSRDLVRKVVDDLYLYAPVYERGDVKSSLAYVTSPVLIEFEDPEKMMSDPEADPEIFFDISKSGDTVVVGGDLYPVGEWVNAPYGKMRFIKNENYLYSATNPLYFVLVNPKVAVRRIQGNLWAIAADKLSTVVHIGLLDQSPQRAEKILDKLIYWYGKSSITEREKLAANTLKFIDERMTEVEAELNELEGEIQRYRSTEGVVDLSEQSKFYLQNVGEYDRRISEIRLQLAILDRVESYVKAKNETGSLVPSTFGVSDPVLAELLNKLYDAETQYEKLSKTTAQNNPVLLGIKEEIEKLRPSILDNIQSQRENLSQTLISLGISHGKYDQALQQIPMRERELLEINRRKAVKNEQFAYLLQKREETALFYSPNEDESQVVDKSQAGLDPVEPKPMIIYAIALIMAVGGGITYVMGKEVLNRNILFRSEIEEYTDIPIVGELPIFWKEQKSSGFCKARGSCIGGAFPPDREQN